MSGGISHQKLTGTGTSAYQLLQKTIELVSEIQKLNYPDIYKMAKMFAPNVNLIPISKSWRVEGNSALTFDGTYFGYFEISHNSYRVADRDNGYCRSIADLYSPDGITASTSINVHGDDVVSQHSRNILHTGFGTGMVLRQFGGNAPEHDLTISFVGFKLGEDIIEVPPIVGTSYITNMVDGKYSLTIRVLCENVAGYFDHVVPLLPLSTVNIDFSSLPARQTILDHFAVTDGILSISDVIVKRSIGDPFVPYTVNTRENFFEIPSALNEINISISDFFTDSNGNKYVQIRPFNAG